jgi:hypothetical protein
MSFYPDMGQETMVASGEHVRAVGWLHRQCPFPQGDVPAMVIERMREFARRWWESTSALDWGVFLGVHNCEFCGHFHASGNFGVPDGPLLFVAPEMVLHYVEQHKYLPPDEFISALMESPLPGTDEYSVAVETLRGSGNHNIEVMG